MIGFCASRTGSGKSWKAAPAISERCSSGNLSPARRTIPGARRPVSGRRAAAGRLPSASSAGRSDNLVHGHGEARRTGYHRRAVRQGRHLNGSEHDARNQRQPIRNRFSSGRGKVPRISTVRAERVADSLRCKSGLRIKQFHTAEWLGRMPAVLYSDCTISPIRGNRTEMGVQVLGHSKTPYPPVSGQAGMSPGRRLPPAPGDRRFLSWFLLRMRDLSPVSLLSG